MIQKNVHGQFLPVSFGAVIWRKDLSVHTDSTLNQHRPDTQVAPNTSNEIDFDIFWLRFKFSAYKLQFLQLLEEH